MSVCERGNKALWVEAAHKSNALCTNAELLATGHREGASAAGGSCAAAILGRRSNIHISPPKHLQCQNFRC